MRLFVVVVVVLLLPLCFFCADARAQGSETITSLSQEIHTQLDSLRLQSRLLGEQLSAAESELEALSWQREELKTALTDLTTSSESMSQRLRDYSEKLTDYERRLKRRRNAVLALAGILLLMTALKVALRFLEAKGVKVPYRLALWI